MLTFLLGQYNTVARFLRCASGEVIALSARLVFASTLLVFFWNSAKTKVGDHIFSPSIGLTIRFSQRRPQRELSLM